MTKAPNSKNKNYDLEDRTAKFGEDVIRFCNKIPRTPITDPLIKQLVKAVTSVGANYCEADDAESKRDFKHKIGICKKECRESKHFIRMVVVALPKLKKRSEAFMERGKGVEPDL